MRLPRLEPEIVRFLKEKLQPIEYVMHTDREEFLNEAIFRAGQRDVISRLEKILKEQEQGV